MASQSAAGTLLGQMGAADLGRRLISGLFTLALVAAVLAAVVALDRGTRSAPSSHPSIREGDALHLAIVRVLDAGSTAESAEELAPSAALDDAWATLAQMLAQFEVQQSVADGTRPPLVNAPPPEPARVARDRALVRSAADYVRGAIETNDVRSLQRARDLLEMRSA